MNMEETNTHTKNEIKPLTFEDLSECISLCKPYDWPFLPPYKASIIERIMNKIGWYRKSTVYVLSEEKMKSALWPKYMPPTIIE